jgi:hypothetical protein
MADYATEASHWYVRLKGDPFYTIIGANGKERPVTVRDAKKLGDIVPSVTSIIPLQSRPGLDIWKQDQTILACLTLTRNEGETEAEYIARLKADSKEQARKAAERGKEIHGYIQKGFEGKWPGIDGIKYYLFARNLVDAECGPNIVWSSEKSFATDYYGGKVDLHSDDFLIDFKTTEKELDTIRTWDEHAQQLAAYDAGLGGRGRKCGILYIHTKTAQSKMIWIPPEELSKGYDCFMALLAFWRAKNGFPAIR